MSEEYSDSDSFDIWEGPTEKKAADLYGPNPEGDAPQGEELVTDPGDAPSYSPLDAALEILHTRGGIKYVKQPIIEHPVLSPTPATTEREELGTLLENAVLTILPANPTSSEVTEALAIAASALWGAGYRKTTPDHHVKDTQ